MDLSSVLWIAGLMHFLDQCSTVDQWCFGPTIEVDLDCPRTDINGLCYVNTERVPADMAITTTNGRFIVTVNNISIENVNQSYCESIGKRKIKCKLCDQPFTGDRCVATLKDQNQIAVDSSVKKLMEVVNKTCPLTTCSAHKWSVLQVSRTEVNYSRSEQSYKYNPENTGASSGVKTCWTLVSPFIVTHLIVHVYLFF